MDEQNANFLGRRAAFGFCTHVLFQTLLFQSWSRYKFSILGWMWSHLLRGYLFFFLIGKERFSFPLNVKKGLTLDNGKIMKGEHVIGDYQTDPVALIVFGWYKPPKDPNWQFVQF